MKNKHTEKNQKRVILDVMKNKFPGKKKWRAKCSVRVTEF